MSAFAAACAVGNALAPGGGTAAVAGFAGGFGDGEAGGAFLGDQRQRRLDQRLAQVAVMVAAAFEAALAGPAHVYEFYICRRGDPAASRILAQGAGVKRFIPS